MRGKERKGSRGQKGRNMERESINGPVIRGRWPVISDQEPETRNLLTN